MVTVALLFTHRLDSSHGVRVVLHPAGAVYLCCYVVPVLVLLSMRDVLVCGIGIRNDLPLLFGELGRIGHGVRASV